MIEGIAEINELQVEMSGRMKSWIYICILTSLVVVVKQTRISMCVCVYK